VHKINLYSSKEILQRIRNHIEKKKIHVLKKKRGIVLEARI